MADPSGVSYEKARLGATVKGAPEAVLFPGAAGAAGRGVPDPPGVDPARPKAAPCQIFTPGALLAGRYRIEREMASGGMGRIFLATDVETQIEAWRTVVLKVLGAAFSQDGKFSRLIQNEANVLSRLNNDSIARCLSCFILEGGAPVLVMEYVEGVALDRYLLDKGGKIGEDECRELLLPVAGALDYAHSQGVMHLDVKPSNIMVRKTPRNGAATCLLDFGISRATGCAPSLSGCVFGSPLYMAPEAGEKPSPAMDVYSLAATAYECLAGSPPYPGGWRASAVVRPLFPQTPFTNAIMAGLSEIPLARPPGCIALVEGREALSSTGTRRQKRRASFPPPPPENLRVSCRNVRDGFLRVEWDWPEDLETCMWAVVDGPATSLEDVPAADRRWISRDSYPPGGIVARRSGGDFADPRVVVFGAYVLSSTGRTYASREARTAPFDAVAVAYRFETVRGGLLGLARRRVLRITASSGPVPELEIYALGRKGRRFIASVSAANGESELVLDAEIPLAEGESLRLQTPRRSSGGYTIVHPPASSSEVK